MKSKNNVLVSIIIPIYNVQDYLDECLLSVINQTYKKIEIICVDDGSTDNSYTIACKFSKIDKRLKVYKKNNGGLSSARNYGIKISKGDYIIFVDSDDYVDKRYVEKLLFKLIENNCDTCICSYYYLNNITKKLNLEKYVISEKIFDKFTIWENKYFNNYPEFNAFCINCAWCKIYKRDFLIKNNFLNVIHEDEHMSIVLYNSCNRILITTEKLYFYRANRKDSIIDKLNSTNARRKHIIDVAKYRYDFFKKNNYPKKLQICTANFFINSYIDNINSAKNQFSFIYMIFFSLKIMFLAKTKYNIRLVLKLIHTRVKNLFRSSKYINKYKISVIIPVYNAEKYLKKCLDSVINQSYKNLEIILIDDGSTDSSPSIIKKYSKKDNRIKCITQKNKGGHVALNNGLKYVTGDFIHFVDSDDLLEKGAYNFLIKMMDSHPNCDLCLFDYYCIDKNDKLISPKITPNIEKETNFKKDPKLLTTKSAQWAKFYKSKLIKENNIKFDNTYFGYDMLFHINVLKYSHSILVIDTPLLYYRSDNINSSSGSLTRSKDYKIHFDCFNHCVESFKKEEKKIRDINTCHQFGMCIGYLYSSLPSYFIKNYILLKNFLLSLDTEIINSFKTNKAVYREYLSIIDYSFLNNYIINLYRSKLQIEKLKRNIVGKLLIWFYRFFKKLFIKTKKHKNIKDL